MELTDGAAAVGDGVPATGGSVESPSTEPAAQPAEQTAPPTDPAPNGNPWDSDLRAALENAEDPFEAATKFIGENIQPRVTQLEQDLAARPELPPEAVELYNDLLENPDEVVAALFRARHGDEAAEKALALIDADPDLPDVDDLVEDSEIPLEQLPPEVQEAVKAQQAQKDREAYDELLADIKAQPGRENLDDLKFAEKLYLADGDVEVALQMVDAEVEAYEKAFREKFNLPDDAEVPAPPPTLNSNVQTPAQSEPPKTYTKWDQLDDAFDDMAAETRTGTPPPVGTV